MGEHGGVSARLGPTTRCNWQAVSVCSLAVERQTLDPVRLPRVLSACSARRFIAEDHRSPRSVSGKQVGRSVYSLNIVTHHRNHVKRATDERDLALLTPACTDLPFVRRGALRNALYSAVCVAAAACGATPPNQSAQGLTVRDSAGVEIVEHSAEYVAALPLWTIDSAPTVRIDGNTPDNAFTDVLRAVRLSDGRFVVADVRQRDLRRFSPTGEFLGVLAKSGRGPGEVAYVSNLRCCPATQWRSWTPTSDASPFSIARAGLVLSTTIRVPPTDRI